MADGIYIMSENERRRFATVVSKVWSDAKVARRFDEEPHAVLREHGIDYPANVAAPPLPTRPDCDLTVEQLEAVSAGGSTMMCFPCTGTATQACEMQ
jgi:hypothetical protein